MPLLCCFLPQVPSHKQVTDLATWLRLLGHPGWRESMHEAHLPNAGGAALRLWLCSGFPYALVSARAAGTCSSSHYSTYACAALRCGLTRAASQLGTIMDGLLAGGQPSGAERGALLDAALDMARGVVDCAHLLVPSAALALDTLAVELRARQVAYNVQKAALASAATVARALHRALAAQHGGGGAAALAASGGGGSEDGLPRLMRQCCHALFVLLEALCSNSGQPILCFSSSDVMAAGAGGGGGGSALNSEAAGQPPAASYAQSVGELLDLLTALLILTAPGCDTLLDTLALSTSVPWARLLEAWAAAISSHGDEEAEDTPAQRLQMWATYVGPYLLQVAHKQVGVWWRAVWIHASQLGACTPWTKMKMRGWLGMHAPPMAPHTCTVPTCGLFGLCRE